MHDRKPKTVADFRGIAIDKSHLHAVQTANLDPTNLGGLSSRILSSFDSNTTGACTVFIVIIEGGRSVPVTARSQIVKFNYPWKYL